MYVRICMYVCVPIYIHAVLQGNFWETCCRSLRNSYSVSPCATGLAAGSLHGEGVRMMKAMETQVCDLRASFLSLECNQQLSPGNTWGFEGSWLVPKV